MSRIPDCRIDEYYNEKYVHGNDKVFLEGYDWATEIADSIFDNIDVFRPDVDVRPSDITTVLEAFRENVAEYMEIHRDELITSMIDAMDEHHYEIVKYAIDRKAAAEENLDNKDKDKTIVMGFLRYARLTTKEKVL